VTEPAPRLVRIGRQVDAGIEPTADRADACGCDRSTSWPRIPHTNESTLPFCFTWSVANAEQVKALVRSHSDGNDSQFYAVALQVAASAARSGQNRFAQELRSMVDAAKLRRDKTPQNRPVPVVRPKGELAGLLTASFPDSRLSELSIDGGVRERLDRVVIEHRQRDRLLQRGFSPLRKLLLVGPPGTGKTLTASALAGEFHLPLFTIRLDGLITKFLGETAGKLRLIFDALSDTDGVYLFDEIDALAGERARDNDVGEIRRVLNSFLQFLEEDHGGSILIAATNHPQLLDRALFRRFDIAIEYPLPTAEIVRELVKNRLSTVKLGKLTWASIEKAAEGLSHAEVTAAAERAAKDAILAGRDAVRSTDLVTALRDRAAGTR